jgi:hypothetical protein
VSDAITRAQLARLNITHEVAPQTFPKDAQIRALFNPNQLRYDNRAEWRATPTVAQSIAAGYQRMEFHATPPPTLTVDLFFDSYEGAPDPGEGVVVETLRRSLVPEPISITNALDVRRFTQQVANLATVQKGLHRPPVCILRWGNSELFRGVLTQLHQDFTFFLRDGTPVRATLGCTFMGHRTFIQAVAAAELQSADVAKRRVVRRGDTLNSIAFEEYNDPGRWREIAAENAIDNPRTVPPGTVLVIPKLTR